MVAAPTVVCASLRHPEAELTGRAPGPLLLAQEAVQMKERPLKILAPLLVPVRGEAEAELRLRCLVGDA